MDRDYVIERVYQEGYAITPEALKYIEDKKDIDKVIEFLSDNDDVAIITDDLIRSTFDIGENIDVKQIIKEKADVDATVINDNIKQTVRKYDVKVIKTAKHRRIRRDIDTEFEIMFHYRENFDLRGNIEDFVSFFRSRYRRIGNLLQSREDMRNPGPMSINLIKSMAKTRRDTFSVIGIVNEITRTKNDNIMITLEDMTDTIRVIVSEKDLKEKAKSTVTDEIIGVKGIASGDIIIAENIVFPDIPLTNNFPRANQEIYAAFISDIHVGSNQFLRNDFLRFIEWISGELPDQSQKEKEIAARIGYIFIAGDCVDGIGVYKGQEKELEINDIYEQYRVFSEFIEMIPENIRVFIIPGNHDATREAEPQPPLPKKFASDLYDIDNVVLLSNPSMVKVNTQDVPFKVLMYHGASIDSLIDAIPTIDDGYNKPHNVMVEMLRKRHIAPVYGSKHKIFPEKEDWLVIDTIPDIFHTGHVHTVGIGNYRGVKLINSGTFQDRTEFQIKLGHHPVPSVVPILDMKNAQVFKLNLRNGRRIEV